MRDPLTREAIARAAREILVAEGLHAVSLRRVASRLGVTAPALYAHVADKRDLLQGIAEQEVQRLLAQFDRIDADDPIERVRLQCHAYMDYACSNPDLFRAMFLFRPELTAEPRGDQAPLVSRLLDRAAEPVRAARQSGRLDDHVDPELAALTIWTAVHGAASLLLTGPRLGRDLEARLADSVINSVLAGIEHGVAAAVA